MSGIRAYVLTLIEYATEDTPYLVFRIDAGDRRNRYLPESIGRVSHTEGPPLAFLRGGLIDEGGLEYCEHEDDVAPLMDIGNARDGVNVVHLITRDAAELVKAVSASVTRVFADLDHFPWEAQVALLAELDATNRRAPSLA
ncbi:MAG TPA: hypothetical protein VMR75_03620 [Candidatus Saccharimonadales bacterium]|nr:hypothetical protein [Candidatus Saccharimonadales bacterium]